MTTQPKRKPGRPRRDDPRKAVSFKLDPLTLTLLRQLADSETGGNMTRALELAVRFASDYHK